MNKISIGKLIYINLNNKTKFAELSLFLYCTLRHTRHNLIHLYEFINDYIKKFYQIYDFHYKLLLYLFSNINKEKNRKEKENNLE